MYIYVTGSNYNSRKTEIFFQCKISINLHRFFTILNSYNSSTVLKITLIMFHILLNWMHFIHSIIWLFMYLRVGVRVCDSAGVDVWMWRRLKSSGNGIRFRTIVLAVHMWVCAIQANAVTILIICYSIQNWNELMHALCSCLDM